MTRGASVRNEHRLRIGTKRVDGALVLYDMRDGETLTTIAGRVTPDTLRDAVNASAAKIAAKEATDEG